jgi:hypothetical protein
MPLFSGSAKGCDGEVEYELRRWTSLEVSLQSRLFFSYASRAFVEFLSV